MKNTINKISIIVILLALLTSCEKEFNLDLKNTDKKIVINSVFNATEPISIEVLKNFALTTDLEVTELENAKVSLFADNNFVEDLIYQKLPSDYLGKYISTTVAVQGKEYTIKVENPDFEKAEAKSTIPNKIVVNSVNANYREWGENNATSIRFDFSFILEDPIEVNKYFLTMYLPVLYVNPTTNDTSLFAYQCAEILTGSLPKHQLYEKNGLLFTDEFFNNTNHKIEGTATSYVYPFGYFITDEINEDDLILDTTNLYISIHHLSYELYNFYSSHATKLANENDLYSEPTPVFSNVKNGLGIFGGKNITLKQVIIEY